MNFLGLRAVARTKSQISIPALEQPGTYSEGQNSNEASWKFKDR